MRRRASAWVWRWNDGSFSINFYWRAGDCLAWHEHEPKAGQVCKCTITYDDGRKPRKRRAK